MVEHGQTVKCGKIFPDGELGWYTSEVGCLTDLMCEVFEKYGGHSNKGDASPVKD